MRRRGLDYLVGERLRHPRDFDRSLSLLARQAGVGGGLLARTLSPRGRRFAWATTLAGFGLAERLARPLNGSIAGALRGGAY